MCSPTPPTPPDPRETSAAQTGTNIGTAIANNAMGMVNQNTPYGSLAYEQTGSYSYEDPYTGQTYEVPRYSANTTLNPAQQATLEQNQAAQGNLASLANERSEFLRDYLPNTEAATDQIDSKLYDLGRQRIDPRFERQGDTLRTRLANQGIAPGSEAYNREMEMMGQNQNDAYTQLMLQGRGQAMNEVNAPINQITALLSGSQVSNPNVSMMQPQGAATTDVGGMINQNYGQRQQNYQSQMAQRQDLMGGLFGLGAAGIGAGWFLMSIFGGNTGMTYEQLQQKRKIAERLMAQNAANAPRSVGQGLSAIGNALLARSLNKKADARDAELRAESDKTWGDIESAWGSMFGGGGMGGGYTPPQPTPEQSMGLSMGSAGQPVQRDTAPAPAAFGMPAGDLEMGAPDMSKYRSAIASIESAGSGDYQAVGPTNERLGRALGRYQIMEANLPQWSQAALGRTVTADEFLASPEIQDAIFDNRFGGYVDKFGEEGAAQAWFAGEGGVGKMDRRDVLGTSVADYTQKFSSALGAPSGGQGAQMAQAGPDVLMKMAEIASSPYASPGQKAIISALMQRQMQQSDPMRQLQMEKLKFELDQARNPEPDQLETDWINGVGLIDTQTGDIIRPAPEGGAGGAEYGLTPQYVTTPDGQLQMVQISKDGGAAKLVELPEGAALQKGVEKLDLGTEFQWYNTLTGEPIGQPIRKDNYGEARETALGSAEGKSEAESGSEMREMQRNMPGLLEVADQLYDLAGKATYTASGQLYDEIRKQTGVEPREAAVARAEYIAVVDNQVLPLLRQTFGAAFTAKEGETLRATLGDPDKSPAEKRAVLSAFIAQKKRDLEARGGTVPQQPSRTTPQPQASGGAAPRFNSMDMNALTANPPTTEEEAAAWNKRFEELSQ